MSSPTFPVSPSFCNSFKLKQKKIDIPGPVRALLDLFQGDANTPKRRISRDIPAMNILSYIARPGKSGELLQKIIDSVVSGEQTECYRTIEELAYRLRQPVREGLIAVLHAADRQELAGILSLQHLLQNIPIVFILPDRDDTTIAQAHRLFPRFISYIDNDYGEIKAVLNKMLAGTEMGTGTDNS